MTIDDTLRYYAEVLESVSESEDLMVTIAARDKTDKVIGILNMAAHWMRQAANEDTRQTRP